MDPEKPEGKQEEMTSSSSDWDKRVLCSDGNCIGVIGADGRCKECGQEYEGDLPDMDLAEDAAETVEEDVDSTSDEPDLPEDTDIGSGDEWENRVLCSDGNCIGVIGPDGKCKECGKPLESRMTNAE